MAIGGPTGAFIVILYGIHATYGPENLVICTVMAGVILLIMGFARLGTMIKYIPFPVTMGFTSGIAVLIFATQIKDFFGLQVDHVPSEFVEDRETIDPMRALTEPNAEHRRALTQILGWDRVLQHVNLSEVARDEYGVLLQTDTFNDDDAPARFVRVSCTTTGRVYHFRVPPDCTTPRHALGWKYHPARPERGRDVDPLWYQPSAQS